MKKINKIIFIIVIFLLGSFVSVVFGVWNNTIFLNTPVNESRMLNPSEISKLKENLDSLKIDVSQWIRGGAQAQAGYLYDVSRSAASDGIKVRRVIFSSGGALGNIGLDSLGKLYLNHTVSIDYDTKRVFTLGSFNANHKVKINMNDLGNIVLDGTVSQTSDVKLKKNILKIKNPIEKIKSIRGVGFNWKDSGRKDIGVIAQDIKKVFPEAVTIKDNEMMAVSYSKLIAPLIEAVKEQQKIIENQNILLKKQKEEIDKIKKFIGI